MLLAQRGFMPQELLFRLWAVAGTLHGNLRLTAQHRDAQFANHFLQGNQLAGQGWIAFPHQNGGDVQVARHFI